MKQLKILYLILPFLLIIWGCEKDFIAVDISKKTIDVSTPIDNSRTKSNQIIFWWEDLEGAENYQLQVVSSTFTNVSIFVVDTTIQTTKFSLILKPGQYQWKIRALNAGYKTNFQMFTFHVDTTSDLAEQFVSLLYPTPNLTLSTESVNFKWGQLPFATSYQFILNNGVLKDTTISSTELTLQLPVKLNSVNTFTWNVRAKNSTSQSKYNTQGFLLSIDRKPPSIPGLVKPLNNATVFSSDTMDWQSSTGVAYDSIYVADDSLFQYVTSYYAEKSEISIAQLGLSPNTPGNFYWWKVRSFDAVGNGSAFSIRRKFKLVP